MNEGGNNFLLLGTKFMPEIHLRWAISTYGSCGPFNKSKKAYKNLKKQEIHSIIM